MTTTIDGDAIADCVLAAFDQLPEKRKPRRRNDGSREWVPLAGIVFSKSDCSINCPRAGVANTDPVKMASLSASLWGKLSIFDINLVLQTHTIPYQGTCMP
jgi:hypothetical protein